MTLNTMLLPTHLRSSYRGKQGQASRRKAATLVEFAMVVPIVFILFFAAVEFARVAMVRHSVDNAVYEAARMAMVPGGTATAAQNEARRILNIVGINSPSILVSPNPVLKTSPEVTIRITVPMNSNSYVPPQFFAGKSVTRQLTLRREGIR